MPKTEKVARLPAKMRYDFFVRPKKNQKKGHPERAKNAKSRAPASENEIRLFCKLRKHCACHAKWTCSNSLVAADQNAYFWNPKMKKTLFACTRSKFRKGQMTNLATARQRFCGYIYIYIYTTNGFMNYSYTCMPKGSTEMGVNILREMN